MRTTANVLRADGVCVHFEGVKAVDEVDLVLHHGEILGLIGPNGAGKTTLVNAISGFQRPTAGHVFLDTTDITGLAPDRLAGMGLTRTFPGGAHVRRALRVRERGGGDAQRGPPAFVGRDARVGAAAVGRVG